MIFFKKKTSNKTLLIARINSVNGFTLIFAVLVGSLLVSLGVAIASIAMKQLSISILSRESQIAFYAADSGAECVLYWDIHGRDLNPPFAFPSINDPNPGNAPGVSVDCGVYVVADKSEVYFSGGGTAYHKSLVIVYYGTYTPTAGPCAVVTIKKTASPYKPNIITSRGINDCSENENKYRVERSLKIEYQ